MSYQVLALKWRPQVFDDVVGQKTVVQTLRNSIEQGRIAHAFLFCGVRGVGKTTTARILAKALNCSNGPTVAPCGECPSCLEVTSSSSMDVLEIDGASNRGIDQIRDIIEASRYAPSRDRFKIYIIDEVHMLTPPAFNALLKTLEEPAPHVKFIFATTEYHKVPETILSRCQQFEFRTVSTQEIGAQLRRISDGESFEISEPALAQISRAAMGSYRDAISALDQVVAATGSKVEEKDVNELLGLIDIQILSSAAHAIVERNQGQILRIVEQLVASGRDLQSFSRGLMQFLRDVLVVRVAPDSPDLVELAKDRKELEELASKLSEEDLLRSLDVLAQLESALRWSPEPRFHLEVALLKLSELRRLASFQDLLARFEALEAGRPMVAPKQSGSSGGSGHGKRSVQGRDKRSATESIATRSAESAVSPPEPPPIEEDEALVPEPPAATAAEAVMEAVLDRLRAAKPKLAALVSSHNGVRLDGDLLTIGFTSSQQFIREQVEKDEFKQLLEKEASDVVGRALRVAFGASEPEKSEETPPPNKSSEAETALYNRAVRDPMVRSFVDTFQGEVDGVKALDSDSSTETER